MKRQHTFLLPALICLAAMPALAQTAIGGGACNSSDLNGTYEFLLGGHQVTAAGAISKVFQAVGTASFDGLSKVTLTMTANIAATSQSFGTPVVYSGTYSLQSNCVGSINITTGDTATFTVEVHSIDTTTNVAKAFALAGSDATYAYNGSGNIQPATCPTTLTGVHEFNGAGNSLSGGSVTGILEVAGVLNFDGQGNVTANWTQVANLTSTPIAATGTYTVSSTCLASATLTDTANNKYAVSVSIYSTAPDFALAITSPQVMLDGSGSAAQVALGSGCSASTLNGTYEFVLSGRLDPGGITTKFLVSDGSVTFDGLSKVTFNLTANTVNGSQAFGTPLTYTGTYSVQSNCQGSINITGGDTANFSLVAYSLSSATQKAGSLTMVGTDATYAYTGSATVQPDACAVSTISGQWPFSATGNPISGATISGALDIVGIMQFDGAGNATASWTEFSNGAPVTVSATGTYTVTPACLGTLTLADTAGNKYTGPVSIQGAAAGNFEFIATNPQIVFTAIERAGFGNPGLAVVNAASNVAAETPPGSIFSLYGSGLATKAAQPTALPLPTTLLTTSVTVNGEAAPFFYVGPTQINAQMPEDIKPGVATVVVKNGTVTSNAVAVTVPATGTPGIILNLDGTAVVSNQDLSVNTTSNPAKIGDTVTVWFLGGGPVNAPGPLVTGAATPTNGYSPVSGTYGITVAGTQVTSVPYIGLTPGSVGLYQADFVVPKVAVGSRAIVITISGAASNSADMAVAAAAK